MALRTRSRSTCLRPTSKGSTALIALASHAPAPSVHPAPVIGAAGRGARSCGITFAATPVSAGLIPLRRKTLKPLPARDAPGSAAGSPGGPDGPAQRRSAPVSPGGSRPPAARSHGAEGAGNHTRCRRGSRRDGAPGMERRSCAHLLAISARRHDEVRAAARSCLAPGPRRGLRDWLDVCDGLRYREEADRQACQAALARRIRRRRSAARSSSFRPPQTPYFSGRDSA